MNKQELLRKLRECHFSEEIINAFAKVPRENFVSPELRDVVYEDTPLPIGNNQTISQPYTIAVMLTMLDLEKGQKVLEVGSGCGYVLALINEITKEKVFGIEVVKELAEKSKENLKHYNVEIYNRNGKYGLKENSPFDRILISAACKEVPKTLLNQLTDEGILVAPIGKEIYDCSMVKIQRQGNEFIEKKRYGEFSFVEFVEK